MDHSHFKLKDETKDQVRRGEDHLKEKILHAHDNAIPQKVEIGNKPHRHDEHQIH